MKTLQVLAAIQAERIHQFAKWGDNRHSHGQWLLILHEELDEMSEAILEAGELEITPHLIHEMVQAAAVITAWIEDYTRSPDKRIEAELRLLYGGQDYLPDDPNNPAKLGTDKGSP